MMCSGKSLFVAAVMSLLLLCLCSESEAASSYDCCLRYTERKLPSKIIQSFTEQWANGGCDIDAIIFHTKARAVCADPRKPWVKLAVTTIRKRPKRL